MPAFRIVDFGGGDPFPPIPLPSLRRRPPISRSRAGIVAISAIFVLFCASAHAQTAVGPVNVAPNPSLGGATSTIGGGGSPVTGSRMGNPYSVLNESANTGGDVSGGLGLKVGDQLIKFRGAVGVGEDRRDFRAGAAIPF